MKLLKIIFTFFCVSFLVFVRGSPSEAFQKGHHRGRHGGGHTYLSKHGRHGHVRKHHFKQGRHGHGRTHHLRHKKRHFGHTFRYKHRGYGRRGRLGYRHYSSGLHLGHGQYKYRRYRYRYRYPYHYRPYTYKSYRPYYYSKSYEYKSYGTSYSYEEYDGAWNLLREGRSAEAADAFGRLAQADPEEGMPKIGYALATAELGRLDKGVWAMRKALRLDPESLHYVTVDEHLQPKVKAVIQSYEHSYDYGHNSDGSFMLAALHYMLGDVDAAQKAMERDSTGYEIPPSTENLKELIEQEAAR